MPHFLFELPSSPQFLLMEIEADIAVILPVRVAKSLERGHGCPHVPLEVSESGRDQYRWNSQRECSRSLNSGESINLYQVGLWTTASQVHKGVHASLVKICTAVQD